MLNRSLSGLERTQDWDMWVYVLCVIWQGEAGKKPLGVVFRGYLAVSVVKVSKLSCKIGNFHDKNNGFMGQLLSFYETQYL